MATMTGLEISHLRKMIASFELDEAFIDHDLTYWENKEALQRIVGSRLRISRETRYPDVRRWDDEAAARDLEYATQLAESTHTTISEVIKAFEQAQEEKVPAEYIEHKVPEVGRIREDEAQQPLEPSVEKPPEEASAEAARIIGEGKTFEYIYGVWRTRHHGDAALGKALLLSVGCQSIRNSRGIHIQAGGGSGMGKSDAALQMAELMPTEYLLDGDVTPQALFYSAGLMKDGTIVLIDDIVWRDELGSSVKKITTKFQQGAVKNATVKMEGEIKRTRKRLTFWVSCVDSQADEQIRDRFILANVDESPEHIKDVLAAMKVQDSGEAADSAAMRYEELVCQELIRDLKTKDFEVVIPFSKRIQFRGEPRAYRIFSDMVKAFAAFSYRKRGLDEKGRLVAEAEDFENAKALYEELGGHSRDKYGEAETKVLKAIYGKESVTQADIQKEAGLSAGRVGDILNGRSIDGQKGNGLLHKCPELVVEEGRPKKYSLLPSFNPAAVNKELVSLGEEGT